MSMHAERKPAISYMETYRLWRKKLCENEELHTELTAIEEKKYEIENRLYRELEFGTWRLAGCAGSRSKPYECLHRYLKQMTSGPYC